MEFRQDWLMRQIEMLVGFIAFALCGKTGIEYRIADENRLTRTDLLHSRLLKLIDDGRLNEAEDALFAEFEPGNERSATAAVDFYQRLNALSDERLEQCGFPREEIQRGLLDIAEIAGIKLPE